MATTSTPVRKKFLRHSSPPHQNQKTLRGQQLKLDLGAMIGQGSAGRSTRRFDQFMLMRNPCYCPIRARNSCTEFPRIPRGETCSDYKRWGKRWEENFLQTSPMLDVKAPTQAAEKLDIYFRAADKTHELWRRQPGWHQGGHRLFFRLQRLQSQRARSA